MLKTYDGVRIVWTGCRYPHVPHSIGDVILYAGVGHADIGGLRHVPGTLHGDCVGGEGVQIEVLVWEEVEDCAP